MKNYVNNIQEAWDEITENCINYAIGLKFVPQKSVFPEIVGYLLMEDIEQFINLQREELGNDGLRELTQ